MSSTRMFVFWLLAPLAFVHAQTAIFDLYGSGPNHVLGYDGCALGDVDFDGIPDFVVVDVDWPVNSHFRLSAHSGFDGRVIWTYTAGGQTVVNLARLGDVDGDGVDDVVMDDNSYPGALRALSGFDGHVLWSYVTGPGFFDYAPRLVDAGRDVDGDGIGDVLAYGVAAWVSAARAEVHSGATGAVVATHPLGSSNNSWALALSSDMDGDGFADVIIGPGTQVEVRSGPGPALALRATIVGPANPNVYTYLSFGSGLSALGDVDGDGLADLAIAMRPFTAFTPFPPPPTPPPPVTKVYRAGTWTLLYEISGATVPGGGAQVVSVGDLNADGRPDFLQYGRGGASGVMGLSFISGASGATLSSVATAWTNEIPRFRAGADFNLDGVPEFLRLESFDDGAASDAGRARVMSYAPVVAASVVDLGGACGGTGGGSFAATPPKIGGATTLALAGATPFAAGNLALDFGLDVPTVLGSGCVFHLDLVHAASWWLIPIATDATGSISFPVGVPSIPLAAGLPVTMQFFLFGTAGPLGFDLSNGLRATLGF